MTEINKIAEVLNFIDGGNININPHGFYICYINKIHNFFLDRNDIDFEKRKKLLTHCNELLAKIFDHDNDDVQDYWIGIREMIIQEIGLKELDDITNHSNMINYK